MPKKTHGLGRGLDSLFQSTEEWGTGIQEIPVGELDPNPDQPRKTFNDETIAQLADSIREQGVLQPLLVGTGPAGRRDWIRFPASSGSWTWCGRWKSH